MHEKSKRAQAGWPRPCVVDDLGQRQLNHAEARRAAESRGVEDPADSITLFPYQLLIGVHRCSSVAEMAFAFPLYALWRCLFVRMAPASAAPTPVPRGRPRW